MMIGKLPILQADSYYAQGKMQLRLSNKQHITRALNAITTYPSIFNYSIYSSCLKISTSNSLLKRAALYFENLAWVALIIFIFYSKKITE